MVDTDRLANAAVGLAAVGLTLGVAGRVMGYGRRRKKKKRMPKIKL